MKRNKRITVVVMAVTLVAAMLAFTGCQNGGAGSDAAKDMAGVWKCTSLDMGQGNVLDQLGSTYADSISFTALDNGEAQLQLTGSTIPMHWKWMNDNKDYKITITLDDYAKAYGMSKEDLKKQMQGSGSVTREIQESQEYAASIKDGKLTVDMAVFYDNAHKDDNSDSSSSTPKMEFQFERTGDAPDSLDEPSAPTSTSAESEAAANAGSSAN